MIAFGDNLKKIRTTKGISQEELARMVNMHSTHISRYERNLTSPSLEVLRKLAEKLEVSTDTLVYGTGEEKAKHRIYDDDLLNMFKRVQALNKPEVDCVKTLLRAFVFQKDVQQKLAV